MLLEWKRIASRHIAEKDLDRPQKYSWPDALLVADIPISTPHSLSGIAPEIIQAVETLQMCVFPGEHAVVEPEETRRRTRTGESEEETTPRDKKVVLPKNSFAIVWKQDKVLGTAKSEEKMDLCGWLQKFLPWDRDRHLCIADATPMAIFLGIQSKLNPLFLLQAHCKIRLDEALADSLLKSWLWNRTALGLPEIEDVMENIIRTSDLFLYPPEELTKNRLRQTQIEKKVFAKITDQLPTYGVKLDKIEVVWKHQAQNTAAIVRAKDLVLEQTVDNIEKERLEQSLRDARLTGHAERPPAPLETGELERKITRARHTEIEDSQDGLGKATENKNDRTNNMPQMGASSTESDPLALSRRELLQEITQPGPTAKDMTAKPKDAKGTGNPVSAAIPDLPPLPGLPLPGTTSSLLRDPPKNPKKK